MGYFRSDPSNQLINSLVGITLFFIYLLPTSIAVWRRHGNAVSIAVVNVFLGWTFFAWVGALAWALYNDPAGGRPTRRRRDASED